MTRPLRDVLLAAVPAMPAPADRAERIAARVRRRRRRRRALVSAAAIGAGVAVLATARIPGHLDPRPAGQVYPAVPPPATSEARPSTEGRPTTESTRPARSTAKDPAGGASTGPGRSYDPALLPRPAAGSTAVRVRTTSERPVASGVGIFRTVCGYARLQPADPLVAPGRPGAVPLQVFWGNTSADASSTATSVAGSGASTCRGGVLDRSAYWATALVDTQTGAPAVPEQIHVFFSSGYQGVSAADVKPFPTGLRATADGRDHVGWQCWTDGSDPVRPSLPDCPAGPVAMVVTFPQCWDGVHLDTSDHRSHLAYPVTGRGCPATHPTALPEMSYRVLYRLPSSAPGRWRTTSDAVTAGWIDGWSPDAATSWGTRCVRASLDCHSHLLGDGRAIAGDL